RRRDRGAELSRPRRPPPDWSSEWGVTGDSRGSNVTMFEIGGGFQELLVILVVALLVVGPKRLPEVARAFARAMRELRRAQDDFPSTMETNPPMNEPDGPPAPDELGAAGVVTPHAPTSAGDPIMTPPVEATGVGVEPYLAQRGARLFH